MLLNMAVKINSHILLDFQILLYCKRDTMIKQYVFVVSLRFFFSQMIFVIITSVPGLGYSFL